MQNRSYLDIPEGMIRRDAGQLAQRETFRVRERTFVRDGEGAYTDGQIVVFHDQQDSTSWTAKPKNGTMHTGMYWAPEFAVEALVEAVQELST